MYTMSEIWRQNEDSENSRTRNSGVSRIRRNVKEFGRVRAPVEFMALI
jgi:hypothetical protein